MASSISYSQDSDWIVSKIDTVSAEGTPTSSTVRYRRDGNEYPYEAAPGKGTIAVKSMNASTAHATIKIGTATTSVHTVIARDGKSFTRTTKGTDAQGRTVNNQVVFEKQ